MDGHFTGKRVFLTGGAGAFGRKFLSWVESQRPELVTIFSRDEMKHAALKRAYSPLPPWLRFRLGDITCKDDVMAEIDRADVVVHAAAMKHLPECEANPLMSVRVNVLG